MGSPRVGSNPTGVVVALRKFRRRLGIPPNLHAVQVSMHARTHVRANARIA